MLMHRTPLDQHVAPEHGESFVEARRAINDDEFRRLQDAGNEIVEKHPPGCSLSPPMFLTASSTF